MTARRFVARHLPAVALLATLAACSGSSPTGPTPTPTPQGPAIAITGNLGFGTVQVGSTGTLTFSIRNTGSQPLIVSSLTLTGGLASVTLYSWIAGTIAPGATQDIVVQFKPTAAVVYSGTLTVNANHVSGTNTIPITGGGTFTGVPVYFRQGVGDSVFDLPAYVTRIIITGTYTGFSSNFIVRVSGSLVVNELLGTGWQSTVHVGTYQVTPGTVQITNSSGVNWTVQEFRQ